MAERGGYVEIETTAGEHYMVTPADFHKVKAVPGPDGKLITYEQSGAVILHWNDGRPYEEGPTAPKPKSRKKAEEPAPSEQPQEEVTHG
jgi:hypothetical protein